MANITVFAQVLDGDRLECRIVARDGDQLTLTGSTSDQEPTVAGAVGDLAENPALLRNAWAYAKFTYQKVNLPTEEEQRKAEKQAGVYRDVASWIAEVAVDQADDGKIGWCSGCFTRSEHRISRSSKVHPRPYVCRNCGSPTQTCAGPGCVNMAVRSRAAVARPKLCAEHRHEIPGFDMANRKMGELCDYERFYKYDKRNIGRQIKIASAALAVAPGVGALAFFAAPAIGGAVGTLVGGYTGAAATSYGLALLGGGSVAAGGLGMAGGTVVVTAVGGALGGALGASVTSSYLSEDRSFSIEKLCAGGGVPVVVCNGFLTENGRGWADWENIVRLRYPDSPVYRVHWGSKELRHLGSFLGLGAAKAVGAKSLGQVAMRATRVGATRIGPLSPLLLGAGLLKNPWHVAKNRAEKTGVVVADLLARTEVPSYVLVGHSLGARAMVIAAQTLGSKPRGPRVESMHLLGAAIGAKFRLDLGSSAVDGSVYNYHSRNDYVLRAAYKVAQGGESAAGFRGFAEMDDQLQNIDVSDLVISHSEYLTSVTLS